MPIQTASQAITNEGTPFGFRNQIINGGMSVAQRGTSFTSNGYTVDRWTIYNGGGTFALSQQASTPGSQPAPGLTNFLRVTRASPSSILYITQKVEDVKRFDGAPTITVSFYAKASGAITLPLRLQQEFDSGAGGSASVQVGTINNSVTTNWQRFTCTYNVQSLAGKTIQTNSYLEVTFDMPATTETLDITGVQLEFGSVATSFEKRPQGLELQLCQRYYCGQTGSEEVIFGYLNGNNVVGRCGFPVTMRANPTVIIYAGNAANRASQIGADFRTVNGVGGVTTNGFRTLSNTAGAFGNSPYPWYEFTFTASAEI